MPAVFSIRHGIWVALGVSRRRRSGRDIEEHELSGFKFLKPVERLLSALRDESNPNRNLHFDHYVVLLLFFYCNPILDSLRGLQKATEFPRVRKKLGIPRSSLGSLSAAQRVFDPEALSGVLAELLARLPATKGDHRLAALKQVVTVADGTLLKAMPDVVWALWVDNDRRAVKAHVQFEVLKDAPAKVEVTEGNGSERDVLARNLESNRLYVMDSGYAAYALFQQILDAGSSFVCRLPGGWTPVVLQERPLTEADREQRVIRDCEVQLGTSQLSKKLKRTVRLVEIQKVEEPSKRMRKEREVRETIVLVTDRLDLPAETIALLYSERWKIELFFRWLKCVIGCKDLLAESRTGVALQLYSALICCLLISLWTGKKPTKRTYEALCFYLSGLADEKDVLEHVARLKPHSAE